MLIEVLVGAGVVTLGMVAARALRRARGALARPDPEEPAPGPEGGAVGAPARTRPPTPRGLRVGDVLLHAQTEMWLAGEIHLDEEGFALSLFPTPGAARCDFVAQLDAEGREVALLRRTDEVPAGAVPTELPVSGLRLSLSRRGQADVRTQGEHLPFTRPRARFALLGAPGGKRLVVIDFEGGERVAACGELVARELYDLLPGDA